jgi:hypothetical protein
MPKRRKIAVTVSPDALAAAERLRQKTGESRSAVFERALRGLVALHDRAARSRRYVQAYRRHPETRREVTAALRAAVLLLGAEAWDEAR